MDPAKLGVVLDSSVVIEAEQQQLDEREAAMCAISIAELAHGIHRASTVARRQARRTFSTT